MTSNNKPSEYEEENSERKPLLGGAALVGGGALLHKSRPDLTGRTRLYHGAAKANLDKIRTEGLLPQAKVKGPAISDILEESLRKPSQDYVFFTPLKSEARGYGGQADFLRASPKGPQAAMHDIVGRMYATLKAQANPFHDVIEADIPMWKKEFQDRLRANPETRGSFEEYKKGMGMHGVRGADAQLRPLYDSLNRAQVFEGAMDPSFIRGKKFKGVTFKELVDYAKARPGQFAKGVGLATGGLALAGLGAHQLYRHFVPAQVESAKQDAQKTVLAHYGLKHLLE